MAIDVARCKRGMRQIEIEGAPRALLIEEAIRRIQADPVAALAEEYLGIKNYASFGDQREDHRYGYGPAHGSIVFRIGRHDAYRGKPIDADGRSASRDGQLRPRQEPEPLRSHPASRPTGR